MSREQKLFVLEQIASKTVREAESITFSLSSAPEMLRPDRVHTISEGKIEIKLTATRELRDKIERLKGWLPRKRRVNNDRQTLFQRARNQCENCGSNYALEVDHIQPQAFGGSSATKNLGIEKMRPYLQ